MSYVKLCYTRTVGVVLYCFSQAIFHFNHNVTKDTNFVSDDLTKLQNGFLWNKHYMCLGFHKRVKYEDSFATLLKFKIKLGVGLQK